LGVLQSAISNQQSAINNQQSAINNQQSTINNQLENSYFVLSSPSSSLSCRMTLPAQVIAIVSAAFNTKTRREQTAQDKGNR